MVSVRWGTREGLGERVGDRSVPAGRTTLITKDFCIMQVVKLLLLLLEGVCGKLLLKLAPKVVLDKLILLKGWFSQC